MHFVHPRPIVGVIPAAGRATRLAPLPCSKELLPIGVHRAPDALRGRPKVVSHYLLERMRIGGASRVFFVLRPGKFDIAQYYGDGSSCGLAIGYLMMGEPWGPPFSVNQATPFVADATVLLGFPDILLQPEDGFARAVQRLDATDADIVLGVYRLARHDPIDIVETAADGRVTRLVPKEDRPSRSDHDLGYLFAAWAPSFTRFLAQVTARLGERARSGQLGPAPEWPVGTVIAEAIGDGLHVDSVHLDDGSFLDIGSPQGWATASAFPGVWNGEPPSRQVP
jgi:glucose-1-phosphate thymidylyltransferase